MHRDVLQRHIVIHGVEEGRSPTSRINANGVTVKRRTRKACSNCASAKARCDADSPCKRCIAKDLQCSRLPRTRQGDRSSQSYKKPLYVSGGEPDAVAPEQILLEETNSSDFCSGRDSRAEDFSEDYVIFSSSLPTSTVGTRPESITTTNTVTACVPTEMPGSIAWTAAEAENDHPPCMDARAEDRREVFDSGRGMEDINTFGHTPSSDTFHLSNNLALLGGDDMWLTFPETSIVAEHQAVIEAQQYWSCFRCNPRKNNSLCPRTGGVLIGSLSQIPPSDDLWGWLGLDDQSSAVATETMAFKHSVVVPLFERVRDKLSAISQHFLRKALRVHCLDPATAMVTSPETNGRYQTPSTPDSTSEGFLILPSAATLEHFLFEYMRLFEPFYTLVPGGIMNANHLMQMGNPRHSTILILLMISQGATSDSTAEARRLSGGLTEVCRISLFDTVEKNVPTSHQYVLMHSALLFTLQASWSGDKWLMDIGMGQRAIYISVRPIQQFCWLDH